jgi:hypothetical protein
MKIVHMDMLQNLLIPQFDTNMDNDKLFQQRCFHLHFLLDMHGFFDEHYHGKYHGYQGPMTKPLWTSH